MERWRERVCVSVSVRERGVIALDPRMWIEKLIHNSPFTIHHFECQRAKMPLRSIKKKAPLLCKGAFLVLVIYRIMEPDKCSWLRS